VLNLLNLEAIHNLLLRAPSIVHKFEERDADFFPSVKRWLMDAEELLVNNRMPVAAAIAGERGTLIAAERGAIPQRVAFAGKVTPRKLREAAAAEVLRHAEELISNSIRAEVARFTEAEKLMRQIVAVAVRKALQHGIAHSRSEVLKATWILMSSEPELAGVATHLVGLIGSNDALVLLDRHWPTSWNANA